MERSEKDNELERKESAIYDVTSTKRYKKIEPAVNNDGTQASKCLVCSEPASLQCSHCEVAQFCSIQHMRMDSVHPKVCDHLAFLNRKQELLPKKEDREQQLEQNKSQKLTLAGKLREMALQFRLEDSEQQAKLACVYSLNIYSDMLGPDKDSSIDVLFSYMLSCISLQQYSETEASMSQVKKYVSDTNNSSFSVKADLEKVRGLLELSKGNTVDALSHFTKEVYLAAHAYGKRHVLATGSLRRLGSSFLQMGKPSVADSLYRKAVEIWVEFLEKKVFEHETVEMQARFVDVVHLKSEALELKVKVEGKDTLTAIYKDRKQAKVQTMRNNMVITCYANGMFAYVSERYIQAYNFVTEALASCKKNSKPSLVTSVTNFYKLCKRKITRDDVKPVGDFDIDSEISKVL